MSSVRVGVIGLGVGEAHIAGYAAHPACELAGLCDIDPEKLERAAAAHPDILVTPQAEELIDDPSIDVVSIATYDSFHFAQVKRALERGKHVFVEKPLCQHEEEARELADLLAEQPRLKLSSNLPLRMSPRFRELREWTREGRFGRLYYLEGDYDYGRLWKITEGWRGQLDFYSVTLGGTIHLIDLLVWLTGEPPVRVTAKGNGIATEGTGFRFNDLVVGTLEWESGLLAKVSANFACVHPHFHGVKVFGTDATWVNGLPDATLWTREGGEPVPTAVGTPYPGFEKGDLIPSFVDSIVGSGEAVVAAQDVFATMAVCFALDRAAATGAEVEVEAFG